MVGEILNMSSLTTNIHRCKLKLLCFKNRHKSYTQHYEQFVNERDLCCKRYYSESLFELKKSKFKVFGYNE